MKYIFVLVLLLSCSFARTQIYNRYSLNRSFSISHGTIDSRASIFYMSHFHLNNYQCNSGNISLNRKIGNGFLYSSSYNAIILSGLFLAPVTFSKWENKKERINFKSFINQYKKAYTTPPVFDHDLWVTNFIGHPYQGSFYYNSLRCQGASILQSSLFTAAQTFLWEYGWEACMEQPSIQDLITTVFAGILFGELCNCATNAMSKHGMSEFKIATIYLINPAYVSHHGFRFSQ
jgi:hypothetical protein